MKSMMVDMLLNGLMRGVEFYQNLGITLFQFFSNIMKKKLSLIVRHRPARKKHNKTPRSPHRIIQDEPCSSAKQYLFALYQHEQNSDNYSRMMLFESNRNQDHSISQWDSKQSQDWVVPQLIQNSLDVSVGLRKNHFRVKTEHKEDNLLRTKFEHEMDKSTLILSPLKNKNKMLRTTSRHQNLSQLQITLPQDEKTSELQLSTISNNKQCIKTIKSIRQHKARIKMQTEVLPVSCFTHDLPQKEPQKQKNFKNATPNQKITLSTNKTVQGLNRAQRDTFITFQKLTNFQKKKKTDILFIRHKLRRREGVWVQREKRMKQFFQVDGHSWISQSKLK